MGSASRGAEASPTVADVIEPCLAAATGHAANDAALLADQLVTFAVHRGLPVEDRGVRRVVVAPADVLTPAMVWCFVADHLPTHVSLPVRRLGRAGRLLDKALFDACGRGVLAPEVGAALGDACRRAVRTLPRLDRFARALRAHVGAGRPGPDLYRQDSHAYTVAMRTWEASRPVADEELEGGFVVRDVGDHELLLSHPSIHAPVAVVMPREVLAQARDGDRIDALLGRHGDAWFFVDSFSVAAGLPSELEGAAGACPRP